MLRSPSAGKLLQYDVEDGDHISAGENYAEIEVNLRDFGQMCTSSYFLRYVVNHNAIIDLLFCCECR